MSKALLFYYTNHIRKHTDTEKQIMALNTAERAQLNALFSKMSHDDLEDVVSLFKAQRSILSRQEAASFYKGMKVTFQSKYGEKVVGTVQKVNRKTINVTSTDGMNWLVSPSLLKAA